MPDKFALDIAVSHSRDAHFHIELQGQGNSPDFVFRSYTNAVQRKMFFYLTNTKRATIPFKEGTVYKLQLKRDGNTFVLRAGPHERVSIEQRDPVLFARPSQTYNFGRIRFYIGGTFTSDTPRLLNVSFRPIKESDGERREE